MGLNRRIFLGTLGSAVGGTAMGAAGIPCLTVAAGLVPGFSRDALAATGPAPDTADEYDALRAGWRALVTGTGYDPQVKPFRTRLATIGTEPENDRTSM